MSHPCWKPDASEWLERRQSMAKSFGCAPTEIPAEVVWFIVWPPRPLSTAEIKRGQEIAAEYGLLVPGTDPA